MQSDRFLKPKLRLNLFILDERRCIGLNCEMMALHGILFKGYQFMELPLIPAPFFLGGKVEERKKMVKDIFFC